MTGASRIFFLIGSLAIISVVIGVYFFGITDTDQEILSYITPLWDFVRVFVGILRKIWEFFLDTIQWIGDWLPIITT